MISDALLTTVITAVAGPIIVLYIANRIKNMRPKVERVDTAFDMYEAIMKRQDQEIQRLTEENTVLRAKLEARQENKQNNNV